MAKINTEPLSGMRDFLPLDVLRRDYVINVIKRVYQRYGFEPLETPTMERLSTLQLAQAYQQVMTEAETLAKGMGYTHVIASKTGKLEFRSTTMNGALQELLARPIVISDSTDDLTSALLAKFPEPAAQGAAPAAGNTPAPAGQATPAAQPK